ncbi:MAG: tRNA dihydrouridine synthase DusB, partial [Bacilli bacterium]|nr:tRNA dihydrouridine synthase DusB [Bacilli bacterium]
MYIGNVKIEGKLALAPLAGYTNKVYRKICHDMGASLTYTEMISDKGLLYENEKTWKLCEIDKNEHPTALQLFGGDIDELTKAAKLIDARSDCDIIDINMGCPVKKVLKAGSGSSLLRNVEYLEKMVRSVVQNVSKPVTVKMRIGFDHNSLNYLEVAKAIERAGAKAICVHGRTKSDFYSGKVNLEAIKEIKENVSIPVIGNGDVKTVEDLDNMLKTGVDLVMIGRASFGNPWIFEEFNAYLNNIPYVKKTDKERIEFLLYHLSELV